MAAGLGTRMRSDRPKHLHPLLGRPVLGWALEAARPLGPDPLVVVCSPGTREELAKTLPDDVELAVQAVPRGTGDAVAAAKPALAEASGDIVVLDGAAPLLTASDLEALVEAHRGAGAAVTVLAIEPDEPLPYGRVLRDETGALRAIVEDGDATPEERAVRELNTSIYVFAADALWAALGRLDDENVQGELYLTDAVRHVIADGGLGAVYRAADPIVGLGINNRAELAQAGAVLRDRLLEEHMLAGVTIVDPTSTWIEADVELEADSAIHPFTVLRGKTKVAAGAEVGPHVVALDAEIGPDATVGPFCYLRPGTVLGPRAKAGAFVEIKKSTIGQDTKVPHLSYIGDAEIGEGTNIGAGSITANFPHRPGQPKGRTTIGDNVRVAVDTMFVAPVTVGDDAWTAAGAVITDDVPDGALAGFPPRQVNKEGRGGKRHD
jgi:bifunctional UDP-N-acetylglucosamine pyrophosphorylase/glucosamine-1-phosphate N-acetyltransferase